MTGQTYSIIAVVFFCISYGSFISSYLRRVGDNKDWNEIGGSAILFVFMAFFWPIAIFLLITALFLFRKSDFLYK